MTVQRVLHRWELIGLCFSHTDASLTFTGVKNLLSLAWFAIELVT